MPLTKPPEPKHATDANGCAWVIYEIEYQAPESLVIVLPPSDPDATC